MALELKQSLRLSQQLVMTPQLQQAIKLLQLSRLELVDLIRSEMEQNPLLEEPQEGAEAELNEAPPELVSTLNQSIEASELATPAPEVAQPDLKARAEGDVKRDDIDWEQYLDNYQTQHTAPSGGGFSSEDLPSLESTLTRGENLTEHLMEQLRMVGLSPEEERIGGLIIGNLNRDGYLVVTLICSPPCLPSSRTLRRRIRTSRRKSPPWLPRHWRRCGASRSRASRRANAIRCS